MIVCIASLKKLSDMGVRLGKRMVVDLFEYTRMIYNIDSISERYAYR